MINVQANIKHCLSQIKQLQQRYHRNCGSVCLLGITKQRRICEIQQAIAAGMIAFGESYIQEALPKIRALAKYNPEWHFVGPIQTNKTQAIAENFNWVHSLDRIKVAKRLSEQRSQHLPPLNVCIQVNISHETTKSGLRASEVCTFVKQICQLPGLRVRGLMAIPQQMHSFDEQCNSFRQLRILLEQLNQLDCRLDTLSMGMSNDFKAAIAQGATIVRIGQAIFGSREKVNRECA